MSPMSGMGCHSFCKLLKESENVSACLAIAFGGDKCHFFAETS